MPLFAANAERRVEVWITQTMEHHDANKRFHVDGVTGTAKDTT